MSGCGSACNCLSAIQVTNPGKGYSSDPTIEITGGGGSQAIAYAKPVSGRDFHRAADKSRPRLYLRAERIDLGRRRHGRHRQGSSFLRDDGRALGRSDQGHGGRGASGGRGEQHRSLFRLDAVAAGTAVYRLGNRCRCDPAAVERHAPADQQLLLLADQACRLGLDHDRRREIRRQRLHVDGSRIRLFRHVRQARQMGFTGRPIGQWLDAVKLRHARRRPAETQSADRELA